MQAALTPEMLATDLAEYLVRKGVSFDSDCNPNEKVDMLKINTCRLTHSNAIFLAPKKHEKKIPFRETHHISGSAVRLAEQKKVTLAEISLQEYQTLSGHFAEDVFEVFNFETSVERKDVKGGTSKRAVLEQIDIIMNQLETN